MKYGIETIITIKGCNKEKITKKRNIQEYIDGICDEIDMVKFKKAHINRFHGGEQWGMGYSFMQFITTSSIVGHFINKGGIGFINIFSCKEYDVKKAVDFTKQFFEAKKAKFKKVNH